MFVYTIGDILGLVALAGIVVVFAAIVIIDVWQRRKG